MFKPNNLKIEQMSLFSKMDSWSDYKKKLVTHGWPEFFRTKIMPAIDEENYSVLYSKNPSKPNSPVNYLVGLLILKCFNDTSDEELVDSALFNEKIQYALGALDEEKQPISKNAVSNFRMRLYNYEREMKEKDPNGDYDLFGNTIKKLNDLLIEMQNLDKSIRRIDSMMISSSCKRLSRMQLIYEVNERFIKLLDKKNITIEDEELKKYLNEDNSVNVLYKTKETEQGGKLDMLLKHSLALYEEFKENEEVNTTKEFEQLTRLISEQYDDKNGKPKEGKEIKSTSMQTPHDDEATYRFKYNHNVGYVANIVEIVDKKQNKIMIETWEVEPNVKSDKEFMKEIIENKKESNNDAEETMIVDAAYFSAELNLEAQEANIKLHPTDMTGKNDIETNVDNFELNDKNEIIKCPNGKEPIASKYDVDKDKISADFIKESCEECPHKKQCPLREYKKKNKIVTSKKQIELEKVRKEKNTEEYKEKSKTRAGIEGVASLLRNHYSIDKRTTKGKFFLKMKLNGSILSINIKRTVKYNNMKHKIGAKEQNNTEIEEKISKNSQKLVWLFFNLLNYLKCRCKVT